MDDTALVPQGPSMEPQQVEEEAIDEALVEDKKLAQAAFHPAWESVQDMILAEIAGLQGMPDMSLIADEYKIEGVSRMRTANILTNLLDRIKNAVESVERTKRVK